MRGGNSAPEDEIYPWNRWYTRKSFVPEACPWSMLREQNPSCVSAFARMFWLPSSWYLFLKDTRFHGMSVMFNFAYYSHWNLDRLWLVYKVYFTVTESDFVCLFVLFFFPVFFFFHSFSFFFFFCLISRRIQMISKVSFFLCFQFSFLRGQNACNFLITNSVFLIIYYGQFNSDHQIQYGARLSDSVRAENKPSENDARDLGKGRTLPPSHHAHPFLHILEPGTGYHHTVEYIRA